MFVSAKAAYTHGERIALEAFGLYKTGGLLLRGAKRVAANVPVAGAVVNTALGAAEGIQRGEGAKGALVRGAISGGTGLISSPLLGMAASQAGDMAADKLLAPKAPVNMGVRNFSRGQGPAPAQTPGMAGQGQLPGMVNY